MTPEGKAKELVNKFDDIQSSLFGQYMEHNMAVHCALICCDEVLGYIGADRGYEFWTSVKQEIEKL